MTNRIFLLECSAPHWISVAKLLGESDINVVYWTGWNRLSSVVKENLPSCIFHDTLFAKRALDPSGLSCVAGSFDQISESVWREDAQVVYDMMNRFDHSRDMTHLDRSTLFYQCLVYWSATFKRHRPDLVIFSAPPHVVYDYIALCLCRRMGIRTLMFEEIPCLPPYSLCMNDYRDGLNNFKIESIDNISDDVRMAISRMQGGYINGIPPREKVVRAEMMAQINTEVDELRDRREIVANVDAVNHGKYFSNEKIVNVSSLYKEKGVSLRRSFEGDFSNTRYMDQLISERRVTQELFDYYHAHVEQAEQIQKFIYFPLAGQPERTSNPQADILSNQILVANLLSNSVPLDWKIAVKEHPNQFHPNFAVNMCRSVDYYEEMLNISGINFVASMHDSFDLIDRSLAVATTGGTAGIEAVARGKPVLLFGDAWYRNCPGVYRVRNCKDVSLVINYILDGKIQLDEQEFMNYMECILRTGFRGIADYPPDGFPIEPKENIGNLVKIICRAF